MRCERCGAELSENGYCPSCGASAEREPNVQILSPAERNAYRGVTIDEGIQSDQDEAGPHIRFERSGGGSRGFSYMMSGGSWQGKLTLILGAAAILLFVFFIALPVALAAIVFSVVSWFLFRLLH